MKNLIALFTGQKNIISFASFTTDVLSSSELMTVRGGGENYPVQEMPIIIPPGEGKKLI